MMYIRVKAFPGFKSEKIEEIEPHRYRVYLRESASDNQANKRLIIAMTEYLGLAVGSLRIVSGHKQQNKMLEIVER